MRKGLSAALCLLCLLGFAGYEVCAQQPANSQATQDPREVLANEIKNIKSAGEDISIVTGRVTLEARLLEQEFETITQIINTQSNQIGILQGQVGWWAKCDPGCLDWVAHGAKPDKQ